MLRICIALAALPFVLAAPFYPPLGYLRAVFAGFSFMGTMVLQAGLLYAFAYTIYLAFKREPEPVKRLREKFNLASLGRILLALSALAGFAVLKPLLNIAFPFWADPLLADIDAAFGISWPAVAHLASPLGSWAYQGLWLVLVALFIVIAFTKPLGRVALSYFVAWSILPLTYVLLPAGGPVFYDAIEGPRMMAEPIGAVKEASELLWDGQGLKRPGFGIMAMPSLHVAMGVWMALVWRPMWAFAAFLWAYSVISGWHYMTDGLVGGAIVLFAAGFQYAVKRPAPRPQPNV